MEVPRMEEEIKKEESHITSAAAFVQGGIQDACDDACSICLEVFSHSDPSTVTSCKHEYHLQCILEWCQRSSNCPMCWQPISLKDSSSQELLKAVERERNIRLAPPRNATIFHHPMLGEFELQHMGVNDPELEDRIIQHLAAAAAMGRTHRISRREGSRSRPSAHARPHFMVFSANPNASADGPVSDTSGAETEPSAETTNFYSDHMSPSSSGSSVVLTTRQGLSRYIRSNESQSSFPNEDSAGPSELQSFSDTWRSRLNTMSMRYKETISKSTRGWKERLFSRSSSMADIGSEVRREVNAGLATVSRMMERLETRDNNRDSHVPLANDTDSSVPELRNRDDRDTLNGAPSNANTSASVAANSVSS